MLEERKRQLKEIGLLNDKQHRVFAKLSFDFSWTLDDYVENRIDLKISLATTYTNYSPLDMLRVASINNRKIDSKQK